jgi:cellulose synthase/poly-beta-1,6-N-acetylglucosamine synthase-like glycosyltransferase
LNLNAFLQDLTYGRADLSFTVVVGLAMVFVFIFLFGYFLKVNRTEAQTVNSNAPGVSIIIASRNAKAQLEKHLPQWLAQDYPNFEVIVANDRSTDDTPLFLIEQQQIHPKLKVVSLDADFVKMGGKKLALTLAIKKAQYQHFLFTDVDCIPSSDQWLKHMSTQFSREKQIILGVSPLKTGKGFLAALIQHENLLTALHYLGLSAAGKPYMGVGRNLAYTRAAYDGVNGFSSHHHLPAGDDDLFVQEAANATNTAQCINPEAFTYSDGPTTWKSYWKQKKRHMWIGKSYQPGVKQLLAIHPMAQLFFWIGIILWFLLGSQWLWPVIALTIKLTPEWIVYHQKGKLLQMHKSIPLYPIYNLFESFWYVIVGINAFFSKRIQW